MITTLFDSVMTENCLSLPKGWRAVRLGDEADTTSGGTPLRNNPAYYGGDIPWVKSGELINAPIYKTEETITEEGLKGSSAKIYPSGTLLIALYGATVGKLGVLKIDAASNQAVCAIFTCDNINQDYLYYYLLAQRTNLISRRAGGAQPNISQEIVRSLEIPLPAVSEQKRIAVILDKAERLRRTRRYTQQLGDTFLQSVFTEMFGKPLSNDKGWDVLDFESQLEHIDSGWSPVCGEARSNASQWAVLRLSAVTSGIYLPQENKQLLPHQKPRHELEVKRGDVLITRKNTHELVAACTFVHDTPPRLMLPDTIFRFSLARQSNLVAEYLWGLFREPIFRKKVQSLASGSAGSMPNISKEKLLELLIPIPPVKLQEKFARVVQRFERLRVQQREAARQAEHLFQTLLHRAFRGEL